MKKLLSVFGLIALSACSTLAKNDDSPCIAMKIECVGSENILVVGNAEAQQELLNSALSDAKKFERTFGVTPAKTVIVPGGVISKEKREAFKAAGYPVSLPWLSAADKAKLRETSIRRQVEEQTKNLPEAIRESAMKQALAAVSSGGEDKRAGDIQAGAFAHELGHLWFINAFKPAEAEAQTGHAYGGWAPDWLDETAAVLMENAALTEKRRAAFKSFSPDRIIPLREFLTMEHPAAQSARDLKDALPGGTDEGGSRTIILSGKEAEEFLKKSGGNRAADFYAQTQVFSEFLLGPKNDSQLYVSLTEHLRGGGSFETWLIAEGVEWGLPTTLDALESEWQDWIKAS